MSQELILSSNTNLEKYVRITGNFDYDTPEVRKGLEMLTNAIEFKVKRLDSDTVVAFAVGILTDFVDASKNTTEPLYLKFEAVRDGVVYNQLNYTLNGKTMELQVENYKTVTETDLSRSTIEAIFINKAGPHAINNQFNVFINS